MLDFIRLFKINIICDFKTFEFTENLLDEMSVDKEKSSSVLDEPGPGD